MDAARARRARLARMAPGVAAAAVVAEGCCVTGSASATASAAGAAAVVGAIAVGSAWRRLSRSGRLYGAFAAGYAAVWAALISAHGSPFWHGDGWLLAGVVAVSAPWAYRHRWRYEPAVPEPADIPAEISEFQRVWLTYAQRSDSPYEHCTLTPEWAVPGGHQADIVGPRGQVATEDLISGAKILRSAWDTDPTRLFIEPTPDRKGTRARLTVLEHDGPGLAAPNLWTGPSLQTSTGIVDIGGYPDGLTTHGQLWAPRSGGCDFFVVGTTGSGKSAFLELLACEIHLTPLAVGWVSDPQEGQCLPDFIDTVGRYAIGGDGNIDANMKLLRALRRVVFRRSRFFGQEIEWVDDHGRERKGGKKYFDPNDTDIHGTRIPLLHTFFDEMHALVRHPAHGREAVRLLGDISRLQRKAGVSKTYAGHSASQQEMGGHEAAIIRNLLREGTVIGFRTGEAVAKHMLGLTEDPSKLPERFSDGSKTHGLGLISGGPDNRQSQFRARFNTDTYATASRPPAGVLDAMSAEAADMPDDPALAPKSFVVPGIPRVSLIPTAEERRTWAEKILVLLGDGEDHTFGAIFKALPDGTSDRSVRHGLKQLVEQGHAHTAGAKQPYRITDAGRAELERRGVAA